MNIIVKIEDGEVKTMLTNLMSKTGNLKPAMETIGQIVRRSVLKNFDKGGRPAKWIPSKRVLKHGGKTLVDKAILRNSINYNAFSNSVEIGPADSVPYAAVHQFGIGRRSVISSRRVMGAIPARPYLLVQDEDWVETKEALKDHLMEGSK
ncbi:MAG: phage virion morphogenesis protein [Dehalobacter sp. 4CP]|nr:phage virion morphogenesis protein [Dehalobacter sp. 4CP]